MKLVIQKFCRPERRRATRMWFMLFLFCTVSQLAFSQSEISGTVVDEDGIPIVGTTVLIQETAKGAITNIDGKYTIQANDGDILEFSFIGYLTEETIVSAGVTTVDITLLPDLIGMDEVVVVGYGTQRKSDLTSAVVSVSSDEFIEGYVKDAGQLLQGKVAGLVINNPSGNPLDGVQVMLRGISSLESGYAPLVIIDGVPGELDMVAPQDIQSIDVLKDGSAAAIYGTRGTNGVIIITTKKGTRNSALSAEYSGYVSTQTMYNKAPFYGAGDYRRLAEAGVDNFFDAGYDTDWLDQITHTPFSQMHNFSVQGGSARTNYVASINYTKSDGIFNESYLETIKSRIDVTHDVWKDILSVNLGAYTSRNKSPDSDINWAYRQAMIHNPTEPVKNEDGSWYEVDKFQYENPVALLEESKGEVKGLNSRIYGNITLTPIEGLRFNLLLSKQIYNQTWGKAQTFQHIASTRDGQGAAAERSADANEENLLEFTGEYAKSIKEHRFNIIGGYSYQHFESETFWMRNKYFPSDVFTYHNMALGTALTEGSAEMTSDKSMEKLIGFFGRVNYSYAGKYLFAASIRHEGSSKFGENNKWGNFPAVQVGWRISKESFMNSLTFITDLKIRAGYGITGIAPSDPYKSLTTLNYSSYVNINGEWLPTIMPDVQDGNPNPDLRWEKKKETNIGIDYAFLNGRISGTFDYYQRNTEDLLYEYPVASPPNLVGVTLANAGSIESSGMEILLNVIPVQRKDFQWISSFNIFSNKSKLASLDGYGYELEYDYLDAGYTGDPIQQSTHRVYVGEEIGNFWGYKVVDLDDRGRWLIANPEGDTIRYTSAQPEDKQVLGNGKPKVYLGWTNRVNYKNFDLTLGLRGAYGFQILNFQRMFYENPTISYNMLESAHDLVFDKDTLSSPQAYVSHYIEDGNFLKIDNLTLGYTLKPKKNDNLKSFRVYFSVLNLYTFTKYKGMDPEVSLQDGDNFLAPGNDSRDKYPTTRTFTVGLNVKF